MWALVKDGAVALVQFAGAAIDEGTGEPEKVPGIFRAPAGFIAEHTISEFGKPDHVQDSNFPVAVFSLWSDAERAGIGLLPLIADEKPDRLVYDWESTFEVQADRVLEHFTATPKDGATLKQVIVGRAADRCNEIDAALGAALDAGMPWLGKVIQMRPFPEPDLFFIATEGENARAAIGAGQGYSIDFTTADNTPLTLDGSGMVAMALAVRARFIALRQAALGLKTAVRALVPAEAELTIEAFAPIDAAIAAASIDVVAAADLAE